MWGAETCQRENDRWMSGTYKSFHCDTLSDWLRQKDRESRALRVWGSCCCLDPTASERCVSRVHLCFGECEQTTLATFHNKVGIYESPTRHEIVLGLTSALTYSCTHSQQNVIQCSFNFFYFDFHLHYTLLVPCLKLEGKSQHWFCHLSRSDTQEIKPPQPQVDALLGFEHFALHYTVVLLCLSFDCGGKWLLCSYIYIFFLTVTMHNTYIAQTRNNLELSSVVPGQQQSDSEVSITQSYKITP